MGEWNTVDGDKSYRDIVEPRGQGRRNQEKSGGRILNGLWEKKINCMDNSLS